MYEDWDESDAYEAENTHEKMTLGHRIAEDVQRNLDEANKTITHLRAELSKLHACVSTKQLSGMQLHNISVKRPWCDVEFGRSVIEEFCRINGLRLDDSEEQPPKGGG